MSEKKAPAEASEGGGKKSKKMLIIIIAAVLLLGGGGAGAYFFLMKKDSPEAAAEKKEKEAKAENSKVPVFVNMDPFTVNLRDEDTERYLQTNIVLQVKEEAQTEEFKGRMPQIRDRILMLLSSKKSPEIDSPEGKRKLAMEVIETLKKPFGAKGEGATVESVFFTSFIIQ